MPKDGVGRLDCVQARSIRGDGATFVFGMPRSGTSWLAKIFDSHPDTLYRHEPDIVVRGDDQLPWCYPPHTLDVHVEAAREYLRQLAAVRTLKSAGPLPVFHKSGRSIVAHWLRTGLIVGLRGAEWASGSNWPSQIPIGDFINRSEQPRQRLVIKSVTSADRIRLFADAWPDSRAIVIVRHPCGQVASMIRGVKLGKFPDAKSPETVAPAEQAARFGLTVTEAASLSVPERLAWSWVAWNQTVVDAFSCRPRVKIVRYRDLAADPIAVARELFAFADLSWTAQTEKFINASTRSTGNSRYYGVYRNAQDTVDRWRQELAADDQARIMAIARRVQIGKLFDT